MHICTTNEQLRQATKTLAIKSISTMAETSAQDQPLKLWQGVYKKIETLILMRDKLSYICLKVL